MFHGITPHKYVNIIHNKLWRGDLYCLLSVACDNMCMNELTPSDLSLPFVLKCQEYLVHGNKQRSNYTYVSM